MRMNEVFRALADPTRREILQILRGGEKSAGELAEKFDITRPSLSHHFAVLKHADLVRTRREGQQIMYALNTTVVQDLAAVVWDWFSGRKSTTPPANAGSSRADTDSAQAEADPPRNVKDR